MEVAKCPCDCKALPEFTEEDAGRALAYLGDTVSKSLTETKTPGYFTKTLTEGMNIEKEHCDVTHGDAVLTAKICLAHLQEDPEYYIKLKKAGL